MSDVAYDRFAFAVQVQDAGSLAALAREGNEPADRADRDAGEPVGTHEPRKMKRSAILTSAVLAQVPAWVQQGRAADEIAARLGCTVGTLRVKCSQNGISLRRGDPAQRQASENH